MLDYAPSFTAFIFGHVYGENNAYGQANGFVEPTIATIERDIWAIKWSFLLPAIRSALQFVVVSFSWSLALWLTQSMMSAMP